MQSRTRAAPIWCEQRETELAAEERQRQILALVDANRSMSIFDLQQKFDVSRETIRRDLLALEKDGKLRRIHGGAVSLEGISA